MPKSQQPEDGVAKVLDAIASRPSSRVLDVGAGEGRWGKLLAGRVAHRIACEVHRPHISGLRRIYDEVEHCNVMDLERRDFDTVVFGDVLEHLSHGESTTLVDRLRRRGVERMYLIIPVTVCVQDGSVYGNPHETHLYQWTDKELRGRGWKLLHVGTNEAGLVAIGAYEWLKE